MHVVFVGMLLKFKGGEDDDFHVKEPVNGYYTGTEPEAVLIAATAATPGPLLKVKPR